MAAEISDRAGQAADLRTTQDTYRRRRQEVVDQNEQDLNRVRAEGQTQVRKAEGETAAAISHVRQDAGDRLELAKKEADQKLTYERKDLDQRFQSAKSTAQKQLENVQAGLGVKENRLHQQEDQMNKRENVLRTREDEANAKIQADAQAHRQDVIAVTQKDVADVYGRAQKKMESVREKASTNLQREVEGSRQQLDQLHDQHQKTYTQQAKWSEAQLKGQKVSDEQRIENERKEFLAREHDLKEHADHTFQEQKSHYDEHMQTLTKTNRADIDKERLRGVKDTDQTRDYYRREVSRLRSDGEQGIQEQRHKFEQENKLLKDQQKNELEMERSKFEADQEATNKIFKEREQQSADFFRSALAQQKLEFGKTQNLNQHTFEETVKRQKGELEQSLLKEKAEVIQTVGKYKDVQDDPFYRVKQIEGRVEETPTHYVLKTEIPAHEKANIKVRVKTDEIVIEGHRRFKDRIAGEGSEISTENYQTFHETIPLAHPVKEKFIHQTYADGILTVTVPKA